MKHGIVAGCDTLDAHRPAGRMEQRQQLGRTVAHVLVRVAGRVPGRAPLLPRVGDRLKGTGFVLAPHGQPQPLALGIGGLDQLFLGSVSGSVTVTVPDLRLRSTRPVAHQLRSRCHVSPVSRKTRQMVKTLTRGRSSGACRRARCSVVSDHVAVPSRTGSGGRRASARIRSRSALVYTVGGPPPSRGSTAAPPSVLKQLTRGAT